MVAVYWKTCDRDRHRPTRSRRSGSAASGATITTLLSPEARHSHLVPAIHRVFGWPPPELPDDSAEHEQDPARAELEALYDSLTREQIAVLAATARAFAGKK